MLTSALLSVCLVTGLAGADLDLGGQWRFALDADNSGLQRGWQQPDFDDSAWRLLQVGATYESQGVSYDGYSWYRLRLRVPADWDGGPALLSLGPIDDADETFLNGRLIGRTGPMGDPVVTYWTFPRLYVLQPGVLRPGEENVLAVRVWDQRGGGGIYQGPCRLSPMASSVRDVLSVRERPWGAELYLTGGARLRLQLYGLDVVRVRAVPELPFRHLLAHDLMLACEEPARASFTLARERDCLWLRTPALQVRVDLRPCRLSFYDARGGLLTRQASGFWWGAGWLGDALTCRPDEHFLGLGEPGPHVDRRGHQQHLWVIHSYAAEDIPLPFLISSAGYGLFFCNSFDGRFDVAASQPDLVQFSATGGEVDYFLTVSPQPAAAISAYTGLTGRSPLPPRWAFGYWQSRAGHGNQAWVKETVERLRRDGFPLDVIHVDGWSDLLRISFSPRLYPDPAELIRWMAQRGVKLCVWETPFVRPETQDFQEGLDGGFFARREDGDLYTVSTWVGKTLGLVDYLSPAACRWRQQKHFPLLEMGVAVFKTDGGDTREVPADAVFHGGYTGHEVHNLYPLLFNRCVYEGQQQARPGLRVINWTRTGYAGIQRYPCTWGGDELSTFEGGRTLIRAGINAGVGGIAFWSHDLGGFADGRTMEYYVRSCQWGFLSPLSRVHGIGDNADNAIVGNEPWVFGPEAEDIVRRYVRLRYRLLPYLYSHAIHAWRTGVPIMRALPLESPDDPRTYACDYEYLLGRDLLVAPIYEESGREDLTATRAVYLPAGAWYDFWTDQVHHGPAEITYEAPFDTLPLFVRAGAVLPCGPDVDFIAGPPEPELTLEVYAGADGSFDLLEDDGVTLKYRDGETATTRLELYDGRAQGETSLSLAVHAPRGRYEGMVSSRPVTFRFHGVGGAATATVNGEVVQPRHEGGVVVLGPVDVSGPLTVELTAPAR